LDSSFNSISLMRFAATITEIAGCEKPRCADNPLDWVVSAVNDIVKNGIDRIVIHNPDAIALWLFNAYRDKFTPVLAKTQLTVPFSVVMPSCTPVCFATMYTGALPEVHGIQRYEKPVVKTDSVYDAFVRAGKKCAIVAVKESSMSRIFLQRDIGYFFEDSDEAVKNKALELIADDSYDLISVYTEAYDDTMHKTGTTSPESLRALDSQIEIFSELAAGIEKLRAPHNTLLTFSPDHGVHDQENGFGSHGAYIPEDINILHFFGVYNGKN
jgi:hypothetical protein